MSRIKTGIVAFLAIFALSTAIYASTQKSIALADVGSAASNTAVDVSVCEDAQIFVGGTFVGTYSVMESADGTAFTAHQAAKTAGDIFALQTGTRKVKITCTAYTSGTIVSRVGCRAR